MTTPTATPTTNTRYREPTNAELGLEPRPQPTPPPAPGSTRRDRRGGRRRGVATVLGVVVLAGAVAFAVAPTQNVHDTWAAPAGVTSVVIDIDGGEVEIVPSDTGTVTFSDDLHYRGLAPDVRHSVAGSTATIAASASRVVGFGGESTLRYRIGVPSGADVKYHLSGGDTRIDGTFGTLAARMDAGELSSSSLRATSVGLEMSAGNLRLGQVTAERFALNMSAGSATVAFASAPTSTALQLSAGKADVAFPAGSGYAVTQQRSAGSVDVRVPVDPASPHAISVQLSAGHVVLRTA